MLKEQRLLKNDEALWDKRKTAGYLLISVQTLDRWIASGRGPRGFKVGVQVRFRPGDVAAYLESCRQVGSGNGVNPLPGPLGGSRVLAELE